MTHADDALAAPAPGSAAPAPALIEHAIALAEAGDAHAALAALDEADALAATAADPTLRATIRINKGFAHWLKGDAPAAAGLFAEAADIARAAQDTPRLASAPANLAAASKRAGRPAEAITAYQEYLPLVADDPEQRAGAHQDCGLSFLQLEQFEPALAHLEEAERIALEADLTELVISARINQGIVREREGEDELAVPHYEAAAALARQADRPALAAVAIERQAQALRQLSAFTDADPLFAEAEDLYRSLGKEPELARTLHWHALAFKGAGMRDRALATWREEELIRRRLDQHAELGECLFEQAELLRDREEDAAAEGVYARAAAAYRTSANRRGLAETLGRHGDLLWTQGRGDEARPLAEEALATVIGAAAPATEARVRSLQAMLLADAGDTDEALNHLDAAEAAATSIGDHGLLTWLKARRAYVFARAARPVEDVAQQLGDAYAYGFDFADGRTARRAVLTMIFEMKKWCSDEYRETLEVIRADIRAGKPGAAPDTEPPAPGDTE